MTYTSLDAAHDLLMRVCITTGCNRLAPDPGKHCDQCLRQATTPSLRAAWHDPELWLDAKESD